jgi:DNA mismatch endonuclease (patch repair protein)
MNEHSSKQRSENMLAIKSLGTKPELLMAKAPWSKGYRYRKNNKLFFFKPDFTFKKLKVAIFMDSKFFHGKDFETKKKLATNSEFWEKKILSNIERDWQTNQKLIW